jgi:hypothetical protein
VFSVRAQGCGAQAAAEVEVLCCIVLGSYVLELHSWRGC